jgi:Phospholipase_D-nuclease N-terminal
MRSAMEAVLLVAALTAISMAMTALHDLLTGPMSWRRKAAWSFLVLSLPLVGPIFYYRRGSERAPRRKRQMRSTEKKGR